MSRPFQRARHVDRREAGTAEADIRALEQELVLALSSLLPPHGKAPSQETARQNAHRLVLELVRRAGVGDPQRLEARLRRVCTLHEVFGGSSWLSATQINALQAAPPSKKSDPAQAWERDGRIFGVRIDGKKYFPAYQFDEVSHRPLPVIREILKRLGSVEDAWAVAVWFHLPNGWINRRDRIEIGPIAPKDALDLREAVLEAAAKRQGTYVA